VKVLPNPISSKSISLVFWISTI